MDAAAGGLVTFGIVFAVVAIQFVMRQCFSSATCCWRATAIPWPVNLLVNGETTPPTSGLAARAPAPGDPVRCAAFRGFRACGLLVFLAVVQLLLLPSITACSSSTRRCRRSPLWVKTVAGGRTRGVV
jgi:hypothetical protein